MRAIAELLAEVRKYQERPCSCGCGQVRFNINMDPPRNPLPGWTFLGSGRGRSTYVYTRRGRDSRIVVKLPLGEFGERCNKYEAECWKHGHSHLQRDKLARCRLVWVQSVPVIVMTRVDPVRTPLDDTRPVPNWAYVVDCQQVGTTPRGRLVAYDYGL